MEVGETESTLAEDAKFAVVLFLWVATMMSPLTVVLALEFINYLKEVI